MQKMNKGKLFICVCAAVFVLIGVGLQFYGRNISEECPIADYEAVGLNSNTSIAQKILGNDFYLKSISFYIAENEMRDNDTINVYLMLGGFDLSDDTVLGQQVFTGSDIKGKTEIDIAFDKIKLISNRDYYVLMDYSDGSQTDGIISFATNPDKTGLYGNGVHYGISLAYSADYFHHINKLLFLWRLAFIFGSLTMVLCFIRNIRFAEAIGLVCIGIMLLTYVFSVFDKLKWSYYAILLLSGIAFVMLIRNVVIVPFDKQRIIWKQNVMPEALCWGIVVLIFLVIDTPKMIHVWDDLVHWARTVQNMYMFESLPLHSQSNVVALSYPPGCSLFQYMFLKFFGRSSASIMYFSLHFLEVSFFMVCFDFKKAEKKNIIAVFTFICVCIGLPELFFPKHMTDCIYIDILVGILLGYTFVRLQKFYEDGTMHNIFVYILSVITLVLTKDNGLIFLLAFLVSQIILVFYLIIKKKNYCANFKITVYTIGAILLSQLSWQICLKFYSGRAEAGSSIQNVKASVVERSHFSIGSLIDFVLGKDKSYKYEIFGAHMTKLFFNGDYQNAFVDMSFIAWFVILCAAFWILYNIGKQYKKLYLNWAVMLFCTGVLIIGAFQLLYMFTFGETDARTFGGEDRYLGSFLIAVAILLVYCVYSNINEISEHKRYVIKTSICIGILIVTNFFSGFRGHIIDDFKTWEKTTNENYEALQIHTESLRSHLKEKDKVFFCTKGSNSYTNVFNCVFFSYYLTPIKFNPQTRISPVAHETSGTVILVTAQEWKEILKDYDYLYIYECDEEFCEEYGELFDEVNSYDDCVLYRVNIDNNSTFLQKVSDLN